MAYSVSKAAGLHLMRCLAYTQGPKVRVNAVQPGLLMTEWGRNFPEEAIERTKERSKLKVAVGFSSLISFLFVLEGLWLGLGLMKAWDGGGGGTAYG